MPIASHRYWRIFVVSNGGSSSTIINEVEFRSTSGGADATGAGTALGTTTGGATPASAFDNNTSSTWSVPATGQVWVGYDFGSATAVAEVSIRGNSSASTAPVHWTLDWSDDGSAWTTEYSARAVAAWSASETRVYTLPYPTATDVAISAAGVYLIPGTGVGQTISAAGVYVLSGKVDVRKAHGYALLTSAGDRIGLQKAMGYAVLNGQTELWVRKAYGYAVLHDTSINLTGRRRALTVAG